MSANLSAKDIPSDDLDLNSNAGSLEDQDESFRVCGSESSEHLATKISGSVTETLAEEGVGEEIRVSDGDSTVEPMTVDALASGETCGSEGVEKGSVKDFVDADVTEMIADSAAERAEAGVEEEIVVMDDKEVGLETKNEVPGDGTLDENPSSCADRVQSLEGEGIGGCAESVRNENRSCEGNDSVRDESVEAVAHVVDTVTSVDGGEKVNSQPVEESSNEEPHVAFDSNSAPEASNISEVAGTGQSSYNEGEPGSIQVAEFDGGSTARTLDSDVQVTERLTLVDRELKSGNEVAKAETPLEITKSEVEQVQVFVGGEAANVEIKKVLESREEHSQIDASNADMSCPGKIGRDEAEAPGSDLESLPNGDRFSKSNHLVQDIREQKATFVAEITSNQVDGDENMDSHIAEEKLHGEDAANVGYVAVSPESLVEKTDEIVEREVSLPDDVKVPGMKPDMLEINTGELEVEALDKNLESLLEEPPRSEEYTSTQIVKDETVSVQVDKDEPMDSHPVEENLHEGACEIPPSKDSDISQARGSCPSPNWVSGSDPCHDFVSVGPLRDGKSNSEMQIAVSDTSLGEEQKVGPEVVGVEISAFTANASVPETEGAVGVQVAVMSNVDISKTGDKISEINALEGNPSLLGKSHLLEDEVLGRSTNSCLHEHLSIEESTPMGEIKQVLATEVVSSATNGVDGEGELNSPFVEDNLSMEASGPVDSDAQAKSADVCQASVSAAFIPGEGESKSIQVISASESDKDILKSEVQLPEDLGLEGEGQKAANESASVDGEMETTELSVEQIQFVGEQVAAKEEVSLVKDEVSVADDLDRNCPGLEKSQILGDVAVGSTEPLPNGDLSYQWNISEKDGEQERDILVTETVPYQECDGIGMDLYPVEENRDEVAFDVHSENEPVSAFAAESVETSFDVHLDSEVQVTEGHASPTQKDQIMGTYVTQHDTNPGESADDVEAADGSIKLKEQQIANSHSEDSQVNGREQIVAGSTEDLESFPAADGNLNAEDDVQKEDVSQPDEFHGKEAIIEEMSVEMGCSVFNHSDENAVDGVKQVCPDENENLGTAVQATGFHQLKSMEAQSIESATLKNESDSEYCARYHLAPEKEGEFSVSDLVWGKVKSHPWWPGQIFDPSDSSEQALRYQKKDSFLVAYFGDQTFAWNDSYSLKPFRMYFPQMEKQSSTETFRGAVGCALNEVQRRVELGMACSCTPKEAYTKVKAQVIENAGIREEARISDGIDKSLSVYSFEPDKLVLYIKALGLDPCGARDRLELVVAEAQLKAFYCLKGFSLPEFHVYGGFSETDLGSSLLGGKRRSREVVEHTTPDSNTEEQHIGTAKPKSQGSSFRKRKHVWEEGLYPIRKEKGLSELMTENDISTSSSGKSVVDEKADSKSAPSSTKLDAVETAFDDSAMKSRKEILSPSRDADTESPAPQSFKVGECIRRIASKLTGSPPILKCSGERFQKSALKVDQSSEKDEFDAGAPYTPEESQRRKFVISKECSSPEEMLSQLCLAGRDPTKGYSFFNAIISFFTVFRNSICLDVSSSWKHKKSVKMDGIKTCTGVRITSDAEIRSANTFDFEDMSDTYWTDRVIQSSPEEQPRMNRKRKGKTQVDPSLEVAEPDRTLSNPTFDANEQDRDGNDDTINEKPPCKYRRRRRRSQLELPTNMDTPLGSKQQNHDDEHHMLPVNHLNETPTALILNFPEVDSVPSEKNLNKIFSRFGPLKESETEVTKDTGSARVVFKKRTDAEVACGSAAKFSIFGSTVVTYQLMYLSSATQLKSSYN